MTEVDICPDCRASSGYDHLPGCAVAAAAPDLLKALKATTAAINAAIQMGMAEVQGHERTAARLDLQIEAARALSRAALAKVGGH